MIHFEIRKFEDKKFYFNLKMDSGQVIQSDSYTRKRSCLKGIKAYKRNVYCAKVKDLTES